MKSHFDLIVVGGGPAGVTLATLVKKYNPGKKILILDRTVFPRHHIGESIIPAVLPILDEMGVLSQVRAAKFIKKVGAVYLRSGQDPWTVPFKKIPRVEGCQLLESTYAWQVPRANYDKILLDHAKASDIEVWEGHCASSLKSDFTSHGYSAIQVRDNIHSDERWLETEMLADCSGQGGFLNRYFQIRSPFQRLSNLAIYGYYRCDPFKNSLSGSAQESLIMLDSVEDGWLWYIPIASDTVSVGFVCNRKTLKEKIRGDLCYFYEERLRQSPHVWRAVCNASRIRNMDHTGKDLFVIRDYSYLSRKACGRGWISAGDAAYFVDPILSTGVFMAHMTGMRAAYTVNSLWRSKEFSAARLLRSDYNLFVRQLSTSFIQMALFWYNKDHTSDAWCRLAKKFTLGEGGVDLAASRLESFIQLTSGLFPYRSSISDNTAHVTGASLTLQLLNRQKQKEEVRDADPATSIPIADAWCPRLKCRYQLLSAFVMQQGLGTLMPTIKVCFKIGKNAALYPTVSVTKLHLQVLKDIYRAKSVLEIIRHVSVSAKMSMAMARLFVLEFLKTLYAADCLD